MTPDVKEPNSKIVVRRAGGPDRLRLEAAPTPACGPREVLVRNEAVGVAFADVLIREGLYPGVPLPATPGYEVVGRVVARGAEVTAVEVGARVAALTVHGGYARFVTVPAADVVAVPAELSSPAAASLVLNGLTAHQMLTRCVARESTETLLVWGAAGGVGSVLLDFARHFGMRAYGVASRARLDLVAAKGATPIDREAGDVVAALRSHEPEGVDAVFDGVGGPNVAISRRCLREGGTVVMFGVQGLLDGGRRRWPRLVVNYLRSPWLTAQAMFMSNRGLKGYLIEPWKRAFPNRYREDLAAVFALAARGVVTPQVEAVLPLAEAARAHAQLGAGRVRGKLVLAPFG